MANQGVQVLERGDLYFFVRPEVNKTELKGPDDVERLYIILNPDGDSTFREIVVPKKKMPDVKKHEKFFGFVEHVFKNPEDLREELGGTKYETKTRGEHKEMPARPVAEGRYVIADHDDHTHLAYALELPKQPKEVQKDLDIEQEGSYVISIRNPEQGSQFTDETPKFPQSIKKKLGDTKFAKHIDSHMLDYEHTELILIGADESPEEDLGVSLDPQNESLGQSEIVKELKLEKCNDRLKFIEEGKWD